jgi:hypothetical protein
MSDKQHTEEKLSNGGIPLTFRVFAKAQQVPHEVRPAVAEDRFDAAIAEAEKIGPIDQVKKKDMRRALEREAGVEERAKAISYVCPDLDEKEARALAELEPRLSFNHRAIRAHVLEHVDSVVERLSAKPAPVEAKES